jgi:hypothetical protein
MATTTVTSEQLAQLKTALENAVSGKAGVQSASYPAPKVKPVNSLGVLEPDTNDAVNNTYIVIDPAPTATSVVSFYWNGDYTIPAETSDVSPMMVKVPPALVIAAANKTIAVIYAVVGPDDPQGVASSPLSLVVGKYTEPAYPKPVITQAQAGDPYPLLDVSKLTANANVTVQPWTGIAVGQMLWLNAVSSPPIKLTKWQGFRITSTGVQSTVIGLAALQTLDHDTDLTLKLEVSFDGGLTKTPFPHSTYKIINAKELDLPAPVVKEASKGVLSPINVPSGGATATVNYTDMLLTDSITLIWNGDKTSIGAASGNAAKSVDFNVPVNLIAAAMGKSIEVSYEVTRDGKVLPSRKLTLSIGTLSEADLGQSKPVITEANGTTTLDLNNFTGDAHITVSKWPLAAVGQRVWLTVYGPAGDPLAQLLAGFPITDADGLNGIARALARALLQGLAAGATIKVEIKVTFDGSTNETDAIRFPESVYSVVQQVVQVKPTITSVVDAYGYGISNGGMTYASSGRTSGRGTPSGSIELYDGNAFIRSVPVDGNGQWSTEWGAYAAPTAHSFTARNPGGGLSSNAWTFRIEVTLVRDHTSFENNSLNGWQYGSIVSPNGAGFGGSYPSSYWYNVTGGGSTHAGVVMTKTLNNMKVGALYEVGMWANRIGTAYAAPVLSCGTSQGETSGPVTLTQSGVAITRNFIAHSNTMIFNIKSHVATDLGNDYAIHGIDVTYVSG